MNSAMSDDFLEASKFRVNIDFCKHLSRGIMYVIPKKGCSQTVWEHLEKKNLVFLQSFVCFLKKLVKS